ncbi:hypothetical protein BS50DRAFT_575474 [Corynespora cassiicola Philippines]|uniref:Rhodopsin domain-containing protein n=1 Tax=Corynespora cassiicola Philippines TaxID=1448308 RepID=A0A2T2NJ66_CORCC|nr:hypothetical protein BS50DRAFT_575474 [Corynespora cassiicola Philippines]
MAQIPPGTDLSQVPMGPNPSGAPPDFEHGPSLIGGVQGVGISLAVVTTAFLITRLRVYVKLNRGLVLDDVFLLIAYVMALSYTVQASTLGRLCRHTWDTPLSEINEDYLKKLFATSIVYGPMFFFAKAAILILYYRAFGTKTWMRWTCWTMGVILFGAYWQTVPQTFIYCMPHNGRPWDATILVGCNRLKIPGLVHGAMNVAADIIMVIMPLPIIIKLHVPLSRKIALSAIFATGLLALICSALAVYYRVEISYGNDPVWSNAQAWIVIQAEIYAAICVACAPSLAKAWKWDFKSSRLYATLQSLLHSSGKSTQGSYPSKQASNGASESVSALQKRSVEDSKPIYSLGSIGSSDEGYEMQDRLQDSGVYRQFTIDVRAHPYNGSAV